MKAAPMLPQAICGIRFPAAAATVEVDVLSLGSEFARCCIPSALVPSALVVVDAARIILDANQRAKDLLAGQHGIEDYGGTLKIKRANLSRTIAQMVQWAAGADAGSSAAADIVGIPDDCGQTRFAVRVLPCRYLGSPGALIVINDLLSKTHASRGTLAKLFSLSAREAEFAERFASGARVEQIASEMAISSNTARIHLRHLFLKTGCKTQAGLARLFAKVP